MTKSIINKEHNPSPLDIKIILSLTFTYTCQIVIFDLLIRYFNRQINYNMYRQMIPRSTEIFRLYFYFKLSILSSSSGTIHNAFHYISMIGRIAKSEQ